MGVKFASCCLFYPKDLPYFSYILAIVHLNLFIHLLRTYEKSLSIVNHNTLSYFSSLVSLGYIFAFMKMCFPEFRLCCILAERRTQNLLYLLARCLSKSASISNKKS